MSSDADVRADVEKMCAALLQLLPLQDEREALSIQGITYMSDCVLGCACQCMPVQPARSTLRPPQPHHQRTASQG
jgi:hypothetical protein